MTGTGGLLARVRRRMAAAAAVEDLQHAAAAGAAAALVVLVLARLGVPGLGLLHAAAAGALLLVAVPLAGFVLRRRPERVVAAVADQRLHLAERVSTALWCEREHPPGAALLAPLVVADAKSAAARVTHADVARAFRPRLFPRRLACAAVALAGCAAILLVGPSATALVETEAERKARVADEARISEVARKIREAARRVEEEAKKRGEIELEKTAAQVRRQADTVQREPPARETVLKNLNALADLAREHARKTAGMREATEPQEASALDRALEELLSDLAKAGVEGLDRDLRELQERLKGGESGSEPPTASELREMASRIDALRRAIQRAQSEEGTGSRRFDERLRSLANADVLEKIAERLRQIAARLDLGEDYSGLQPEDAEGLDLSDLSREELEALLKDLDELAGMEDLAEMLQRAAGEMRGGKKLRFGKGGGT